MAECFCGCGRSIGFGSRGMNKNGRRTAELVEQLRTTDAMLKQRGPLGQGGDAAPMLAGYEAKIDEGVNYELAWQDIVHSGADGIPTRYALAFKREWSKWGKDCLKFDSLVQRMAALSPEEMEELRTRMEAENS